MCQKGRLKKHQVKPWVRGFAMTVMSIVMAANVCFSQPMMTSKKMLITIMTFNIENGGTQIDFNKVVEAIQKSGADVVGIQEAWGNIPRLAQALGWRYFSRRQHIISRFPLIETSASSGHYLWVEIFPKHYVAIANFHLPDDPYGPYQVLAGDDVKKVLDTEKKTRLSFARLTIKKVAALLQQHIPVFVTGDFNSPSHLDWGEETVNLIKHHVYAVTWPVSKTLTDVGFKDCYRSVHADVLKFPGTTWPALRPVPKFSFDGYNPKASDIADRIDFIYAGGAASIVSSQVLGESASPVVDLAISPWPSDHRAVVASAEVVPAFVDDIMPRQTELERDAAVSSIQVSAQTVNSGQPFKILWHNAPGNRLDYIRINPLHSKKLAWGEVLRLYTHGQVSGKVLMDVRNKRGNWRAWYQTNESHWPLKPGVYEIKLMADDSETVLAETSLHIVPQATS